MLERPLIKASLFIAAGLILLAVFAAYLRPEFMVDLANRVMFCFQ